MLAAFQQCHQLLPLLLPAHERGCAEQRRHFVFGVNLSHGVSVAEGQPLLHLRQHKVAMVRSIGAVGPEDVGLVVDPCPLVLPVIRDACGKGLHGLFVAHLLGHAEKDGHLGPLCLPCCRLRGGLPLAVLLPGIGGGKVMLGRPLLLDKRIMPVQTVFLKTQVGAHALQPAAHRRILTQGRFAFRQKLHAQSVEVGGVGRFFGGEHGQFAQGIKERGCAQTVGVFEQAQLGFEQILVQQAERVGGGVGSKEVALPQVVHILQGLLDVPPVLVDVVGHVLVSQSLIQREQPAVAGLTCLYESIVIQKGVHQHHQHIAIGGLALPKVVGYA